MDPAEQRANAVAMLRRAASLPRMKDGRRPPMHGESGGVSEGERSTSQSAERDQQPTSPESSTKDNSKVSEKEDPRETGHDSKHHSEVMEDDRNKPESSTSEAERGDHDVDATTEPDASEPERPASATPSQQASSSSPSTNPTGKRRSRSRSRSRGSRDMRAKMRQLEVASALQHAPSPDPSGGNTLNIAGPDDVLSLDSPVPTLTSQQAYLMQLQRAQTPFNLGINTNTLSPASAAVGMPSLQTLQNRHLQGLFRSNSAAARMMALNKLNGVDCSTPTPGPASAFPSSGSGLSPSPSPAPGKAKLMRNNTVAGEERVAARQQLLRRLNERIQERGDPLDVGSSVSGGAASSAEEAASAPATPATKSKRRRSRRKSGSAVVDDRDRELLAGTISNMNPLGPLGAIGGMGTMGVLGGMGMGVNAFNAMAALTGTGGGISTSTTPTPGAMDLRDLYPPLIALPPSRAPSVPIERQVVSPLGDRDTRTPDLLRTRTPTPHLPHASASTSSTSPIDSSIRNDVPTILAHRLAHVHQYDSPMAHRGPVVEEEDDEYEPVPTPPRVSASARGAPLASSSSVDSRNRSPYRQEVVPKSPFERPRQEPDEELVGIESQRVLYGSSSARVAAADELLDRQVSWIVDPIPAVPRRMYEENEREISWNAEPVPEAMYPPTSSAERDVSWIEQPRSLPGRMPVYDEDEDDEDIEEEQNKQESRQPSPREAVETQLLIDLDGTADNPEPSSTHDAPNDPHPPSPTSSIHSNVIVNARESAASDVSVAASAGRTSNRDTMELTNSQAESLQGWGELGLRTSSGERLSMNTGDRSRRGSASGGTNAPALSSKRSADSTGGTSTWNKVKNTFTRSGSSLGRRSRTNSLAREKKGDTESSRESAASLMSGKRESKGEGWAGQATSTSTSTQRLQAGRAPSPVSLGTNINASVVGTISASLMPPPPRTGASPIPPLSDSEAAAKYTNLNPKLFPFPGIEALRSKTPGVGVGFTMSTPDVTLHDRPGSTGLRSANSSTSISSVPQERDTSPSRETSGTSNITANAGSGAPRDRKLSHHGSDSRLLPKYQLSPGPAFSGAPSSAGAQIDYFNIPQPPTNNHIPTSVSPLPRTREGVRKWLSARLFPSTSQQGQASNPISNVKLGHDVSQHPSTFGSGEQSRKANLGVGLGGGVRLESAKKPSLTDLLATKIIEKMSEWEETDKEKEPEAKQEESSHNTNNNTTVLQSKPLSGPSSTSVSTASIISRETDVAESSPDDPLQAYDYANAFSHLPTQGPLSLAHKHSNIGVADIYELHESRHLSSVPVSSSHDPSSATPDPASSEESPSRSSHGSRLSLDSLYSPEDNTEVSTQAVDILQRLDQALHADYHNRLWANALTSPPRRLLLSSPMLQVANCNTVKDRFLFLFTDVLIIAKPMLPDRDSFVDTQKVYPPDRKFFIKNVVHLKDLRLSVDRDSDVDGEGHGHGQALTSALISQRPEFIRKFIYEFSAENVDRAVSRIVDVRDTKGCAALGRLLVQLPEIDRAKLGEYLSRRSSKTILKAYLEAFGFMGINIDTALRIFLLSIHMPQGSAHANTLEMLLDTFAGRWYEANANIVAFDRDLAVRLVRAIVRLNEALHAANGHESGSGGYGRPHITSRDFTEAFRRHDPRSLVPDSTLEKIYASVRSEKLCQARNPSNGRAPSPVSLKRPIPPRITYRRQSEPIVVRVPQADPTLTIQLFGQDLTFDPPVLSFAKSSEQSFRVTGTAFGPKTMVMACSGPSAPNYSGLPLSTTIVVERAFMRNTFQLAFADMKGRKRKYMFSVDDPVIRHEWTSSIKRQIEAARAGADIITTGGAGNLPTGALQVYRAAEILAFSVLQETLLTQTHSSISVSVNGTLRQTSKSTQDWSLASNMDTTINISRRSQSRSQIYRLGAGRHEYEVSNGSNSGTGSGLNSGIGSRAASQLGIYDGTDGHGLLVPDDMNESIRLWTGAELEMVCQQNSSIALVLSLLQAALPYDVDDETSTGTNSYGFNTRFQFPGPALLQRNQSQSSAYQI